MVEGWLREEKKRGGERGRRRGTGRTVQCSTLEVLSGEVEHGYDVCVSCRFSEVARCSRINDDYVRHV
jgi:hypothetical protein